MVVRAANGLENSRSTLMTGIPASIALVATSVRAAPSVGSSTIASTLSLMNVSIWLIWRLASLVPSAALSSTSLYFLASASAELLIAASQPWSAAGPEKPMTTFLPGASLSLAALAPAFWVEAAGVVAGSLLVHPAATRAELRVIARTARRLVGRESDADTLTPM